MFKKKQRSEELEKLEAEIGALIDQIASHRAYDDKAYDTLIERVDRLYKLKVIEREYDRVRRVSPETWALIAANLIGIAIILTHEYAHPITTRAFNFAMRLK